MMAPDAQPLFVSLVFLREALFEHPAQFAHIRSYRFLVLPFVSGAVRPAGIIDRSGQIRRELREAGARMAVQQIGIFSYELSFIHGAPLSATCDGGYLSRRKAAFANPHRAIAAQNPSSVRDAILVWTVSETVSSAAPRRLVPCWMKGFTVFATV